MTGSRNKVNSRNSSEPSDDGGTTERGRSSVSGPSDDDGTTERGRSSVSGPSDDDGTTERGRASTGNSDNSSPLPLPLIKKPKPGPVLRREYKLRPKVQNQGEAGPSNLKSTSAPKPATDSRSKYELRSKAQAQTTQKAPAQAPAPAQAQAQAQTTQKAPAKAPAQPPAQARPTVPAQTMQKAQAQQKKAPAQAQAQPPAQAQARPTVPAPAPAPAQAQAPAQAPEVVLDTQLLLSALDSYHDFSKTSRTGAILLTPIMVKKIIDGFISENNFVKDQFDRFTETNTSNGISFEKRIYAEFVTNNNNIYKSARIQLNEGKNGNKQLDTIYDEIKGLFPDDISVCYISDASSLIKCGNNCAIHSYASWFDKGSGCKSTKGEIITDEIELSKEHNHLLYIDKITGHLDNKDNDKAKGTIKVMQINKNYSFSEGKLKEDPFRPEVSKYAEYMLEANKTIVVKVHNEFYNKFLKKINDENHKCMFIMDLKRSGDRLQIQSGTIPHEKAPIFITSDIIAATVAVNNNVCTILTSKDGSRLPGNTNAIKYAELLLPLYLLNNDVIAEKKKAYADKDFKGWEERWKDYSKETNKALVELVEELKDTSKGFVDKLNKFTKFKYAQEKEHREATLEVVYYNMYYVKPEGSKHTSVSVSTAVENCFKNVFKKIEKTEKEITKIITDANKTFLDTIKTYANTNTSGCSVVMKAYLNYIVTLEQKYIEKNEFSQLLQIFYENVKQICNIIIGGDNICQKNPSTTADRQQAIVKRQRKLTVNPDNYKNPSFVKNLLISIYIRDIFIDDEDLYEEHIGEINKKGKKSDIIASPIGVIFMEYLTTMVAPFSNTVKNLEADISNLSIGCDAFGAVRPHLMAVTLGIFKNKDAHPDIQNFINNKDVKSLESIKIYYERIKLKNYKYMGLYIDISENDENIIPMITTGGSHIDDFSNYPLSKNIDDFMKLPYDVKKTVLKESHDTVRDNILKDIFLKYYNSESYNEAEIEKELALIEKCKRKIPSEIRGGKYTQIFPKIQKLRRLRMLHRLHTQRTQGKPQKQNVRMPKMKDMSKMNEVPIIKEMSEKQKIHSEAAFMLFKEYLYFYPEYIDPTMVIYMIYSKSQPITLLDIERRNQSR
jgi:hypothetical protein